MKLSLVPTAVTLLASAGIAHAGVMDLLTGNQVKRACEYKTKSEVSWCMQGQNVFCQGAPDACESGGNQFDAKATTANEDACKGLEEGEYCTQTIMCCTT